MQRIPEFRKNLGGLILMGVVGLVVGAEPANADEPTPMAEITESPDKLATKCEYGITLALAGEMSSAEQVFTSLLSASPGDPRAYTNLGNVHFLRGDLEVALVFYDKGKAADEKDPGILLNRATTLMLLGEEESAQKEAAAAVKLAGGAEKLSQLIGLEPADPEDPETVETDKASEKTYVSRAEVSALISGSMASIETEGVAADSLGATGDTETKPKKRARLWRSSSPKAADDTEAALVLYWKQ